MNYQALLERKISTLFPDMNSRQEVVDLLKSYGNENYEQEPHRVRLAILKLSGPDVHEVAKYASYAKQDYRDILAWAEYPRQSKVYPLPKSEEGQKLVRADRDEYRQWLNT